MEWYTFEKNGTPRGTPEDIKISILFWVNLITCKNDMSTENDELWIRIDEWDYTPFYFSNMGNLCYSYYDKWEEKNYVHYLKKLKFNKHGLQFHYYKIKPLYASSQSLIIRPDELLVDKETDFNKLRSLLPEVNGSYYDTEPIIIEDEEEYFNVINRIEVKNRNNIRNRKQRGTNQSYPSDCRDAFDDFEQFRDWYISK